ncbi:MFS transporter [Arthrobacter sp. D2-10]
MTSRKPITVPLDVTEPAVRLITEDAASPVEPTSIGRWLWVVYPLAMAAINVVWGGVMQVLLGKQISALIPGATASAAALGTVTAIAAVSSVFSQPIMGRLSDRTRTRFLGRRNAWIFGGAIVGAIGLVLQSQLESVAALAIVWAVLMWPLNGVQAGLAAVLPERVPVRLRGSMSGIVGATTMVGLYAGVALAGLSEGIFWGYLLVAAAFLVIALLFSLTTRDESLPSVAPEEGRSTRKLPSFRGSPDYWLAFTIRFLLMFAYFVITSFQLFILRDHVGISDIDDAASTLVAISGVATILGLVCSVVGGWLADKLGRLRFFVALSTAMFVPAGFIYWFVPSITGAWVAAGVLGAGFGLYVAVDAALISRVLPNLRNAGRDLGIMNIANAGPQIIGPAVAGAVVGMTGSYTVVFVAVIASATLAAISVWFIRTVR